MNLRNLLWVPLVLVAATSVGACSGGGDDDAAVMDDGGAPTDAAPDSGPPPVWPVPSDFPADGPTQPGEGDACRLSVQCTDRRQICVDDACIREERVRVEDLSYGEWRTLTPESTDENPLASVVSASVSPVIDDNGEIAFVGEGRNAAGQFVLFSVGQDVRLVTTVEATGWGLPFRDGFLTSNQDGIVGFVGGDGVEQWSVRVDASPPPPYDMLSASAFARPLLHTPSGPVLAILLASGTVTPEMYDIIELQRLDVDAQNFIYLDFVDGPLLLGASIGQPVMGPTGLELVIGRAEGESQPSLSVYSVASGEERPIGVGPLLWDIQVMPIAANDWSGVLVRDRLAAGCASVAFAPSGSELARSPVPADSCETLYPPTRPGRVDGLVEPYFLRNARRSAWFSLDNSSGTYSVSESPDGVTWESVDIGTPDYWSVASRYAKTWEVAGSSDADLYGIYFAERRLATGRGTP